MKQIDLKAQTIKWINPAALIVSFYFLLVFLFADQPFFLKITPPTIQGKVPEVTFNASTTLYGLIFSFIVCNFFLFLSLKQWARYFLGRKLILSYLIVGIIPLCIIFFIGIAGTRTWQGISQTYAMENTMEVHRNELNQYVGELQKDLVYAINTSERINEGKVRRTINLWRANFKSGSSLNLSRASIAMYYLPPKDPGQMRKVFPMFLPIDETETSMPFYSEDTPEYDSIYPAWITENEWTDIVSKDNQLYIRHFNIASAELGESLVIASIHIDREYLKTLAEFHTVNISLVDLRNTNYITTDDDLSSWFIRLPAKIFTTKREVIALDWNSGYYKPYGHIIFDIDPTEIGRILNNERNLNFFYADEQNKVWRLILGLITILIAGVLIAAIFGIYLVSYITRNLNAIAEGHERLIEGELNYQLDDLGKDQLGSMGRSFNSMVNSIDTLMVQVTENEKYQEELRIAREIQMSLLPDVRNLNWCSNIAATCIPAKEVGGDYYEIVQVSDTQLGAFIADVSGKGTSAAFYMAELKGVLLASRHLWNDPKELMIHMNDILRPALANNVFISAAYLLLDKEKQEGCLVRAGHCPSLHITLDGEIHELSPPGMALGITNTNVFGKIIADTTFPFKPGEKVVLYTDGLDEMTHGNEMYGLDKLKSVLATNKDQDEETLKHTILNDVLSFLASETQNDDLTLVIAGLADGNAKG